MELKYVRAEKLGCRFLLSFALILLLVIPMIAKAEVRLAFETESSEIILDICEGKANEAYLLTSERILLLRREGNQGVFIEKLGSNAFDLIVLCETNNGLFGVSSTNQFYEYHNMCWIRTGGLLADNGNEIDNDVSFRDAKAIDNTVYAIVFSSAVGQNQILAINSDAKSVDVLPNVSPESISIWKDGCLLINNPQSADSPFLFFNPTEKSFSEASFSGETPDLLPIAYDFGSDKLYAASAGSVLCSSAQSGFFELVSLKDVSGLAVLGSESLLAWSGNSVYEFTPGDTHASGALSIMGMSTRFDNAFTASTGISLSLYEHPTMDVMEHLSLALASQDASVDVYSFLTRDGLSRIRDRKMYTDLSQSDVLTSLSHELYPAIRAVLYDEGKLICWPIYVQPLLRMQSNDLLSQYGLDSPNTMDDLLDLLPQIVQLGVVEENGLRLFDTMQYTTKDMMTYLVRQFIFHQQQHGVEVDFNNDIFRHLAQRIVSEVPMRSPFPEPLGDEMPLFIMSAISPVIQEGLLPPLKLDENTDSAIETWVQVAVINPFSLNKSQALQYLEYYAQQKDEESYSYFASMNEPYKSTYVAQEITRLRNILGYDKSAVPSSEEKQEHDIKVMQLESLLEQLRASEYLVTESAIANYHLLSSQFIVSDNELIQYDNNLSSIIDQLVAGRFTLEAFINSCNHHVGLIYRENR